MVKTPRVSVVLPVYNAQDYVAGAIKSILDQTYTDFELIVINDGSTDKSLEVIQSFKDPRLVVVSRENKKLIATLNEGIAKARGEYIARQDADDLSLPYRLEMEVAYLDAHQKVGLVGSNYTIIDEAGKPQETTKVFCHPDDLKVAEMLSNQYGHGSIMMRKSVLNKVGLYDKTALHVEDYDLFTRISRVSQIANIPEPLYLWRRNPKGVSLSNAETQLNSAWEIRDREFEYFVKHRQEFKPLTFHPFDFYPSSFAYLNKKSLFYRNLAWLFRHNGFKKSALGWQILACLLGPWRKTNWKYLIKLLVKSERDAWKYEYL